MKRLLVIEQNPCQEWHYQFGNIFLGHRGRTLCDGSDEYIDVDGFAYD